MNRSKTIQYIAAGILLVSLLFCACGPRDAPPPFGPVPAGRQLEWHRMKYYAFIHFGINTFTDREWGYGDEPALLFNPGQLDCRQWARTVRDAGMEGIIITAKHHDGFCLWPSEYTEYSVRNSPWKNGQGDVIRELREACDEYSLKMGIYLSPWDRNHADYGKPAYIDYYRNQLRELLTNYGEIFEVWFDGAMGGDGYYGGARETRHIDNRTYYDWPGTIQIVRELQPGAVIFSDGGPDVRWIGNEQGYAAETNWCAMMSGVYYPGIPDVYDRLQTGHEDGDVWIPAEVNTSIRPGWFYHASQDDRVKSLDRLIDNWFHSVGMNGNFLLNLPPDPRGLIHENDVQRLMELKAYLDEAFSVNLAAQVRASASSTRHRSGRYAAFRAVDGCSDTYWAADDSVRNAFITLDFGHTVRLNTVLLQEYIALGQRVYAFRIEAGYGEVFREVASGTTVGNRRIVQFPTAETDRLRIHFRAKACPVVSNVEVYRTPGKSNVQF